MTRIYRDATERIEEAQPRPKSNYVAPTRRRPYSLKLLLSQGPRCGVHFEPLGRDPTLTPISLRPFIREIFFLVLFS